MRIEVATSADVDRVTDLWVDLARNQRSYGSHLRSEANRVPVRETIARHASEDTLLVARDDVVVGFVTLGVETGSYAQDCTRGIVQNVYVASERRDEGVGSALLAAAENRLADLGADVVALDVLADNDAARRFYRRAGYEPHRIEMEKSVENDNHSKE
jgi:ribosomal protein S18 acetylase RimI-like enzyme